MALVAQREHVGGDLLRFAGMLRAALDEELAALVVVRQRGVGLEIEVLLAEVLVVTLEDMRRRSQCGLDVASTRDPGCPLEGSRLDRLGDGDQRGKRLVVDLYRRGAEPGRLRRLAEHPADGVAVVHDLGREQRFVEEAAGLVDAGHVVGGEHVHDSVHRERGVRRQGDDARMGVRGLHRPGRQRVRPADGDVVRVLGRAGHMPDRALVRFRDADDGILGDGRQGAHTPATSISADSACSFRRARDNMMLRYSALARWSLIGVPSRPRAAAASRTVSRVPGLADQESLRLARTQRRRGDPAEADPRVAHDAVLHVERETDGDTRDVVETALGDLVESGEVGERQRDADRADELVRTAHGLPIPGEVLAQRDLTFAVGRREDDDGVQGEENGRGVTDRRARAEVAADRRAVPDQPRGELGEQLREQRDAAGQEALGLGQRDGGADLDARRR